MATSYTGDKNGFSYIVGVSKPIDVRTVVNSVADLTNGSIQNPYAGLVVNIKGTSDLYVLITGGRGASNINNWKKVSAGDIDLSEYVKRVELADYLTSSDLEDYVRVEDVADFVTDSDLEIGRAHV